MRPDVLADRERLEAAIEAALAVLDALDGDPDLEPEEDAEHDGREPEDYGEWSHLQYAAHGTPEEDQTRYEAAPMGVKP